LQDRDNTVSYSVRPGVRADVDAVYEVARHLNTVNLPANREALGPILACSEQSFAGTLPHAEREYLFVLEDVAANRIIGTSMIHAQHGTRRSPHIYFQVLNDERYSETLDHYVVHQCLRLSYNYNGPTEIGGLILLPEYRGRRMHLGSLLSYLRFLFIAMHREGFRDEVLSELLPPLEEDGTSRLWKHLGRRFTGLSYSEADHLSKDNKEFIRALFPHQPIYISLFPPEVRELIGQVGPNTKGVEKILRRIGFEYANQLDPFDGGPHFVAKTDDITLVKNAQELPWTTEPGPASEWTIVATERAGAASFRALAVKTSRASDSSLRLPPAVVKHLQLGSESKVWAVSSS